MMIIDDHWILSDVRCTHTHARAHRQTDREREREREAALVGGRCMDAAEILIRDRLIDGGG